MYIEQLVAVCKHPVCSYSADSHFLTSENCSVLLGSVLYFELPEGHEPNERPLQASHRLRHSAIYPGFKLVQKIMFSGGNSSLC